MSLASLQVLYWADSWVNKGTPSQHPGSEGGPLLSKGRDFHDVGFIPLCLVPYLSLFGTEVKSVRQGKVSLKEAWCSIVEGELFVNGMHISPYEQGNIFNKDPMRVRRLLMHKKR